MNRLEERLFDTISTKFQEGIVKDRTVYLLNWYSKKAEFYKRITYFATLFSVLIPALITLLNSGILGAVLPKCTSEQFWTIVLSALSSLGAGLYAFIQSKDHWIRYRMTAEVLKRETILFLGMYEKDPSKCDELAFLSKIERIAAAETNEWHAIRVNYDADSQKPSMPTLSSSAALAPTEATGVEQNLNQ